MLKTLFKSVLLAFLLLFTQSHTQKLNTGKIIAFMVVDFNDPAIGGGRDFSKMKTFLEEVSELTNQELDTYYFKKNELNDERFKQTINNLQVGSNDVVLFYYSGHGANDQQSNYPRFSLGGNGSWHLTTVADKMRSFNPRLSIVFYDCCNHGANTGSRVDGLNARPVGDPEMYRRLFVESRGEVKISAASPGQYSWGSNEVGGLCTSSFLRVLRSKPNRNEMTWGYVLQHTQTSTEELASSRSHSQKPIYENRTTQQTVDVNTQQRIPTGYNHPDDNMPSQSNGF